MLECTSARRRRCGERRGDVGGRQHEGVMTESRGGLCCFERTKAAAVTF
jgi:hypothetical protein